MTADPLAGQPTDARRIGRQLGQWSEQVEDASGRIRGAADTAATEWAGRAQEQFLAMVESMLPVARRVIGRIDTAADVMNAYAEQLQAIQEDAERLGHRRDALADDRAANERARRTVASVVERDDAVEADHVELRALRSEAASLDAEERALDADWLHLVDRRAELDHRTAGLLVESDVVGVRQGFQAKLAGLSDTAFLAAVAALPPDELALLAGAVGARLSTMPAERVARWWDGLGDHSAAQQALIIGLPAAIGNLDGVSYWARDQANRISLQAALADARRWVGSAKRAGDARELHDAEEYLAHLTNFVAGARTAVNVGPDTVRQMVSFHPGPPPLGAFSLGDLDTAAGVSYLVPGMTTTLGDTTVLMRAASNVMAQQQAAGHTSDTALVAWIGYEAPAAPPESAGVFGMSSARIGAEHLSADLAGFRARRPDAQLDVIAHSFGSTTSALALHDSPGLNVHSYVVLGSAGMPWQVPDAASTHAEQMLVAQAAEDWNIAGWGRMFSLEHRRNPAVDFGAETIATSEVGRRVNIHGLTGQTDDHVGYLDLGTGSLLAIATATTP